MRSLMGIAALFAASMVGGGCGDQILIPADCSKQMAEARKIFNGGISDSTIVSPTDKQLGWFYDNGTGTFLDHRTDFNWSSGRCVVTVIS
jgi:hypothetical protein